jgi:hypothetical protein
VSNKENMKIWVDALRSGNYRQTQKKLRNEDGAMCCLGVACEVFGQGTWNGDPDNSEYIYYTTPDGGHESGLLPHEVQEWLGVSSINPEVIDAEGYGTSLANANDAMGWDFPTIADAIERTYLS